MESLLWSIVTHGACIAGGVLVGRNPEQAKAAFAAARQFVVDHWPKRAAPKA
jgi:hypothetical protein